MERALEEMIKISQDERKDIYIYEKKWQKVTELVRYKVQKELDVKRACGRKKRGRNIKINSQ